MNNSSIQAELSQNGRIVYANKGDSMRPLIRQGKDLMVIEKPMGRLKRYDAALYVRKKDGACILHRVLRVKKNGYVICGDNCVRREYGITDSDIIGVLTAVIRNGKELRATSFRYRLYTHIWCDFIFIRIPITRVVKFVKKAVNKLTQIMKK